MESFTMKSRDGRRSVTAWCDRNMGTVIWRLEFTKKTATRSETHDGRSLTKTDARQRAKAWVNGQR